MLQTWAELATEVKDIGQQRIDITTIKMVMKPVQRAVKDVSKSISDSPLYHAALRPPNHSNHSFGPTSPQSLAPAGPNQVQHGIGESFVLCVVFTLLFSFRVAPLVFRP